MRLYKSASAAVKGTEGTLSGTLTFVPTAATAAKFTLGSSPNHDPAVGTATPDDTALDVYGNTATSYAGSKNLTFSGALASASGNAPTVIDAPGPRRLRHRNADHLHRRRRHRVSSTKRRSFASSAPESPLAVIDGTISTATPTNVTVTAARRSARTRSSSNLDRERRRPSLANCCFACTDHRTRQLRDDQSGVAATDTYGNVVSAIGTGHSVAVTIVSGEERSPAAPSPPRAPASPNPPPNSSTPRNPAELHRHPESSHHRWHRLHQRHHHRDQIAQDSAAVAGGGVWAGAKRLVLFRLQPWRRQLSGVPRKS